MTTDSIRKLSSPLSSPLRWKSLVLHTNRLILQGTSAAIPSLRQTLPSRNLAQVRPEPLSELWFTSSFPNRGPADELLDPNGIGNDHKPPDERILKLGKSRILTAIVDIVGLHINQSQPCARFPLSFQQSSQHPSPPKSSRPTYPSTSSHPHTHTSLQ